MLEVTDEDVEAVEKMVGWWDWDNATKQEIISACWKQYEKRQRRDNRLCYPFSTNTCDDPGCPCRDEKVTAEQQHKDNDHG